MRTLCFWVAAQPLMNYFMSHPCEKSETDLEMLCGIGVSLVEKLMQAAWIEILVHFVTRQVT